MQALNVVENPRFGEEKANKIQIVKTDQLTVDALYLKPGQQHGPMRLPERDRAVTVLSGKGELVLDLAPVEQRIVVTPGMVALAPRATWHSILNTGSDNLVVVLSSQFPVRVEERG